jgi:hypothetical protein
MTTKLFDGETGQPIPDDAAPLWCVHVSGPDDVIPAPDEATAIRWAERVNAGLRELLADRPAHEYDPVIKAVAAPWPHSREAHAEGVGDEYSWLRDKS